MSIVTSLSLSAYTLHYIPVSQEICTHLSPIKTCVLWRNVLASCRPRLALSVVALRPGVELAQLQSLMANSLVKSPPTTEICWVETRKRSHLDINALALCTVMLIVVVMVLSPGGPAKPYRLLACAAPEEPETTRSRKGKVKMATIQMPDRVFLSSFLLFASLSFRVGHWFAIWKVERQTSG
ncbi:hypothetical protein B0H65DRAFT_460404 [Neurospora tetraspora]|uniref:Uncharacterized protein n=1 Tax=Neurospora tetraspora TaxID=94610 RepID=A0AAE0JGV8_9PEZI|nr:hypothetical protein B0H65DRAFT_460404 [Neurospora tetraspora]